jgi:hypothetical protein
MLLHKINQSKPVVERIWEISARWRENFFASLQFVNGDASCLIATERTTVLLSGPFPMFCAVCRRSSLGKIVVVKVNVRTYNAEDFDEAKLTNKRRDSTCCMQ